MSIRCDRPLITPSNQRFSRRSSRLDLVASRSTTLELPVCFRFDAIKIDRRAVNRRLHVTLSGRLRNGTPDDRIADEFESSRVRYPISAHSLEMNVNQDQPEVSQAFISRLMTSSCRFHHRTTSVVRERVSHRFTLLKFERINLNELFANKPSSLHFLTNVTGCVIGFTSKTFNVRFVHVHFICSLHIILSHSFAYQIDLF
jgi:hypothetical protein